MAYWIDTQGRLREGDEEEGALLGFRPATDEDIAAHNHQLDVAEAGDEAGALGAIGRGFQRGLGHQQDVARGAGWAPPMPGSEAFGPGGGAPAFDPPEAAPLPPGAETFPKGFDERARLINEARPFMTGLGTGLAVAPVSAVAGAAGAALLPGAVPLVGGTVGGILAEQSVEAVAQEYDDAWLEERPFELKRAAGYLGMFGLGDVLFRGGGKVIGKGLGALTSPTSVQKSALATGRNVVAEAQAQAEKAGARPATRSVGAASAQEMNDPFDDAIGQMSEADAYVLSRDFDDHSFLVARDIADEMTRINKGLSEDLGNDLKYRDFEIAADAWDGSALERQADFYQELDGRGRDLVEAIELSPVDLGNHGKRVAADITQKLDDIAAADTPARRLYLLDQFKRTLDKRTMAIAGDFQSDQVGRTDLLGLLDDFSGGADTRGWLRESIEDANLFGHAAELQKSLNAPWHEMLKSWRKVSDAFLDATGEKQFGVMGAGRNVMEGTVDKARAVIGKDPRALAEFRQHLGHVFDGYQGLIDARNAHGIVEKGNLPMLEQSIRNLMEDWNLGATLGVAKAKAAHIQRNPRHWRRILEAAEGTPGIGGFLKGARQLSQLTGDLHIQKGTTLANVWDEALRRYAKHPSLAEAPIYANYSPWMQDALRTRGARIPGPPEGAGGFGQAAGSALREHGSKVAGAGLIGLGANEAGKPRDPNAPAEAGFGPGALIMSGLMLMTGSGRRSLFDVLKNVSHVANHRRLNPLMDGWKLAEEMLPNAPEAQKLVDRALSALSIRGIDLAEEGAEHRAEAALRDAWPDGTYKERAEKALKEATKLQGGATKAGRVAPKKEAARELLGAGFSEQVDGKYTEDWYTRDWTGKTTQTFGSYGEPFEKVLKRRLADPAPMTLDEVRSKVLQIKVKNLDSNGRMNFTTMKREPYSPEELARNDAAKAAWDGAIGIRQKVEKATEGLDDQFRRVDAEDNAIREVLRDALGMRAPVKRTLDTSTDATSRYRKAKKGFDSWREKALPEEELKATKTWQTHYYRSINADARMGAKGTKQVLDEQLAEGGLHPDQARSVASRATRIGAELLTALNKAVEAGRTVPGRVRRGISMPADEVERLLRAKTVTAQGFMSTSIHATTPKGFAERRAKEYGETPVMLEIEQMTGVPLGQGEGELTLRPGTVFDVLNVERGDDGFVHAYLRESQPSTITPETFLKGIAGTIPTEARIAGGLLAVGAALAPEDARALDAPRDPRAQDRPTGPSPETGPATLYREAVRGIDEGGTSIIRQQASAALRRTPPVGRSPLRAFTGGRRDLDAAVDAARETLATLESDPSALIETLASNMGDLPRTHPSVYMALTEKAVGIVSYLSAAVPERTAQTLLDPVGIAPSADRSLEFAYKVVGATNPRQAMGDISRLDIPPEELEAFQGNWPELWEPFKAELIGQAMRRAEGGRPVDAEKLRQLDSILGMNGQLDPSGSVDVAMHMLAAQEQAPAGASNSSPSSAPSPSGRAAGMFRTRAAGAEMENQIG